MKLLGFIHPLKNFPISNSKLLLLQDIDIIKYYGIIAYDILNWFKCCCNISKVKFIMDCLRHSCLLTLSRKHNKRKTWAYSIFTSELLILKGLFLNESYFPSKRFLAKVKRKFIFRKNSKFLLNESLFLA